MGRLEGAAIEGDRRSGGGEHRLRRPADSHIEIPPDGDGAARAIKVFKGGIPAQTDLDIAAHIEGISGGAIRHVSRGGEIAIKNKTKSRIDRDSAALGKVRVIGEHYIRTVAVVQCR